MESSGYVLLRFWDWAFRVPHSRATEHATGGYVVCWQWLLGHLVYSERVFMVPRSGSAGVIAM